MIRASIAGKAYPRRFRPEIVVYADDPRYFPGLMRSHSAELRQLRSQRRPDPEQKRARREVWRRQRHGATWILAFLIIVAGMQLGMSYLAQSVQ
jgi:hypothetical protein